MLENSESLVWTFLFSGLGFSTVPWVLIQNWLSISTDPEFSARKCGRCTVLLCSSRLYMLLVLYLHVSHGYWLSRCRRLMCSSTIFWLANTHLQNIQTNCLSFSFVQKWWVLTCKSISLLKIFSKQIGQSTLTRRCGIPVFLRSSVLTWLAKLRSIILTHFGSCLVVLLIARLEFSCSILVEPVGSRTVWVCTETSLKHVSNSS